MLHPEPSKIIEMASGLQEPAGKEHLARCPACRRRLLEVEVLRALYLEGAPEVPPALGQKVKLRVIQGLLAGMQEAKSKSRDGQSRPWVLKAVTVAVAV